jgi:hypothetical protein
MLLLMTRLVFTFNRILIRSSQIGGGSRFAVSGILAPSVADEKRDSDLVRHSFLVADQHGHSIIIIE